MSAAARRESLAHRAMVALLVLHLLLLTLGLQGCGGGDVDEPEACPSSAAASSPAGTKPTPRVDCTCNPGACQ